MKWTSVVGAVAATIALAACEGDLRNAWMALDAEGSQLASEIYADQGHAYCVTTVTNGRSKDRPMVVEIVKSGEPEQYQEPDGGLHDDAGNPVSLPPAAESAVAVGDVVAHRRQPTPTGSDVLVATELGALDEHGKPDPAHPLSPGRYRCNVTLSDDDFERVTFDVLCPAGRIEPGSVCTADRALCPARGEGTSGPKCACFAGKWDCAPP